MSKNIEDHSATYSESDYSKIPTGLSGISLKNASPYTPQYGSLRDLVGSEDFEKEYLFQGKEPKKRSWMSRISYDVGLSWGIASGVGAIWGAREGLSATGSSTVGTSVAIRRNAILNGMSKRATFLGNPAAIAALMFNSFEYITNEKGPIPNENINSLISGGLAGLLFKSTSGARPMAVAAALGTATGALVCIYRNAISGKRDIFDF